MPKIKKIIVLGWLLLVVSICLYIPWKVGVKGVVFETGYSFIWEKPGINKPDEIFNYIKKDPTSPFCSEFKQIDDLLSKLEKRRQEILDDKTLNLEDRQKSLVAIDSLRKILPKYILSYFSITDTGFIGALDIMKLIIEFIIITAFCGTTFVLSDLFQKKETKD